MGCVSKGFQPLAAPILFYKGLRKILLLYKHWMLLNRRFAEAVFEVYNDGDVVWVQDYHLMLLPALLKKEKHKMKASFGLQPSH